MRINKGDLFTSDCEALGHGVNVRGLMGAGIAKTFKERYPENYLSYGQQCKVNGLIPGGVLVVPCYEADMNAKHVQRYIVNMASQRQPGPDATYSWLFSSALAAAKQLKSIGVYECAIPEIGCGIGGLEWPVAELILTTIEQLVPGFEWEVWQYAQVTYNEG
jgi:O-acetyl-ADP-ribose deacetylase (regulator of RNase III)